MWQYPNDHIEGSGREVGSVQPDPVIAHVSGRHGSCCCGCRAPKLGCQCVIGVRVLFWRAIGFLSTEECWGLQELFSNSDRGLNTVFLSLLRDPGHASYYLGSMHG